MRIGTVFSDPMPDSKFATAIDHYNNRRTIRASELDEGEWEAGDDYAYRTDFWPGGAQTLINYEFELEREEEEYDY